MGTITPGDITLSGNIELTANKPIVSDMVIDNFNYLFNNSVLKAYKGKTVVVASDNNRENDGSYILFINDGIAVAIARMYIYDTNKEECNPTIKDGVITEPGISRSHGWKKIGEGTGSGSGIDVEDSEGETTKGTTINNDGDVTGTVKNGSITLNIDWSKIECICGGNSVAGDTTITDTDGTGLTIDGVTLKTNGDGEEDTGDENIIYVAQTDGGTWDKTE